jgi:hypothetical protein
MTLTFDLLGTAQGLYAEQIDLRELGTMTLERASYIEFNSKTQVWEVICAKRHEMLFADFSREACLNWEKRYFAAYTSFH